MSRLEVFEKLQEIFMDLLDDEEFQLSEDISMDTLKDWDSLMHITLISSIEDEFSLHIPSDDIPKLKRVEMLIDVVLREMRQR